MAVFLEDLPLYSGTADAPYVYYRKPGAAAGSRDFRQIAANIAAFNALTLANNKGIYATGAGAVALYDLTAFGRTLAGSADAAAVRTALSLVPGTDVEAHDADLTAIAALSTNGIATRTGAGTWTTRQLVQPAAGFTISNQDGGSGDPTFALSNDLAALEALSGTNTIYYRSAASTWTAVTIGGLLSFSAGTLNIGDAELTAIAGLTSAADSAPYFTGSGAAALMTVTSAARTVLDDTTVAAMLATMGGAPLASPTFTGTVTIPAGTSAATPPLTFTGDINTGIFTPTADTIGFTTGGIESHRIDSAQRLLVGASTAVAFKTQADSGHTPQVQQHGLTAAAAGKGIGSWQNGAAGGRIALAKSRSGTIGTFGVTPLVSNEVLGELNFNGDNGTLFQAAASIVGVMDGAFSAGHMAGQLRFYTTNSSDVSTLAMTITSAQRVDFAGAINYGGVTLSAGVTGTGNMVLDNTPTLITPVIGAATGTSLGTTGAITAFSGTAPPASGTGNVGVKFSSTANLGVFCGTGAPTMSAGKGSLYVRTDATTTTTRLYINTDGSTTWATFTASA